MFQKMRRAGLRLVAGVLMAAGAFAVLQASQNSLQMPTTGTVSGLQFANLVTNALDALLTCNSGTSAPTNAAGGAPKLGQCWIDTTTATKPIKKRYSGSAWVVEGYIDVTNGLWVPPAGGGVIPTVASASTTNLCTNPEKTQTISGSVTITSFGSTCVTGIDKLLIFSGAAPVTYNATSMILPSGASVTTAAGDTWHVVHLGSGNWRVLSITQASGLSVVSNDVPVGTVLSAHVFAAPNKYVFGYGQAITRASFPDYVNAVTTTQSVTRTSGSNSLTGFSDTGGLGSGMPIEGTGIPAATTISSCSGTTCTISQNASSSGTSNVQVFVTGYGSGGSTTTVGVLDCRGKVIATRDDLGGTAAGWIGTALVTDGGTINGRVLRSFGGSQSHALSTAELAVHNHGVTDPTHNHGQNAHSHGFSDPGHSHGVTDPSHAHSFNEFFPNAAAGVAGGSGASFTSSNTNGAFTGISINSNTTGASIQNATASNNAASTGISIQNAGSGSAHALLQPTVIANCIVRVTL